MKHRFEVLKWVFVLSFIKVRYQAIGHQVCLTMHSQKFQPCEKKLQEYDYICEYENKIWCIDEQDGQNK